MNFTKKKIQDRIRGGSCLQRGLKIENHISIWFLQENSFQNFWLLAIRERPHNKIFPDFQARGVTKGTTCLQGIFFPRYHIPRNLLPRKIFSEEFFFPRKFVSKDFFPDEFFFPRNSWISFINFFMKLDFLFPKYYKNNFYWLYHDTRKFIPRNIFSKEFFFQGI